MADLKHKILAAVQQDLEDIENALQANLKPHYELVARVAGHILFAGGKRLRPLLMLLCTRLCGNDDSKAVHRAVIFEYLHAATLLHDDVVDGGTLRRGKTTAHHVWDAPTAVLTGDFLLARSLSLAAETGRPEVIRVIAAITEKMSQGEICQLAYKGDPNLSEAVYLDVIQCKTAVLFEGACRVGAILADASEEKIQALSEYGHHLGLAFQISDDLLDYTQDTTVLGKQAGNDLREGKITLPVIYALARADEKDRHKMLGVIHKNGFAQSEFDDLVGLLKQYGGIDYSRQRAVGNLQTAKAALNGFAASADREILADIADYALARSY
jgi:octaprenyl-diphosphate synthase